jgi:hypothetical protein
LAPVPGFLLAGYGRRNSTPWLRSSPILELRRPGRPREGRPFSRQGGGVGWLAEQCRSNQSPVPLAPEMGKRWENCAEKIAGSPGVVGQRPMHPGSHSSEAGISRRRHRRRLTCAIHNPAVHRPECPSTRVSTDQGLGAELRFVRCPSPKPRRLYLSQAAARFCG